MNSVTVRGIENDVTVNELSNTASVILMPVETIQMGFAGLQAYERVEPIVDD